MQLIKSVLRLFAVGVLATSQAVTAQPADPHPVSVPRPAILMFWAAWCAPCRAEAGAYPQLAGAAGNVPLFVVSVDTPVARARSLLSAIPQERVRITPLSAPVAMRMWGEAAGLPFAVMVDASGATCARQDGGLTPQRIRAMINRCRG